MGFLCHTFYEPQSGRVMGHLLSVSLPGRKKAPERFAVLATILWAKELTRFEQSAVCPLMDGSGFRLPGKCTFQDGTAPSSSAWGVKSPARMSCHSSAII